MAALQKQTCMAYNQAKETLGPSGFKLKKTLVGDQHCITYQIFFSKSITAAPPIPKKQNRKKKCTFHQMQFLFGNKYTFIARLTKENISALG